MIYATQSRLCATAMRARLLLRLEAIAGIAPTMSVTPDFGLAKVSAGKVVAGEAAATTLATMGVDSEQLTSPGSAVGTARRICSANAGLVISHNRGSSMGCGYFDRQFP